MARSAGSGARKASVAISCSQSGGTQGSTVTDSAGERGDDLLRQRRALDDERRAAACGEQQLVEAVVEAERQQAGDTVGRRDAADTSTPTPCRPRGCRA